MADVCDDDRVRGRGATLRPLLQKKCPKRFRIGLNGATAGRWRHRKVGGHFWLVLASRHGKVGGHFRGILPITHLGVGGHFRLVFSSLAVSGDRLAVRPRMTADSMRRPAKSCKHLNLLLFLHPENISHRSILSVETCRKVLLSYVPWVNSQGGGFWASKSAHYWGILTAR
jgi:hypothetical protein